MKTILVALMTSSLSILPAMGKPKHQDDNYYIKGKINVREFTKIMCELGDGQKPCATPEDIAVAKAIGKKLPRAWDDCDPCYGRGRE